MPDHIELSIRQFIAAWHIFCGPAPNHVLESAPGVAYTFSGVAIPFFNAAVFTDQGLTGEALGQLGTDARRWAADRNVPWIAIVTQEALASETDAPSVMDSCGFAPIMNLTGMLAEHVAPVERIPEGLELVIPRDDAGCEAILDVNAAAYDMPFEAGHPVWGRHAFWKDHFPVLGIVKGLPVSSSVVMMAEGYRYVALVATQPGHQRRGYADAAMRHSLEISRREHGNKPTFLHASDAGRPVYERMGYEAVSTHTVYMEKRLLAGH